MAGGRRGSLVISEKYNYVPYSETDEDPFAQFIE